MAALAAAPEVLERGPVLCEKVNLQPGQVAEDAEAGEEARTPVTSLVEAADHLIDLAVARHPGAAGKEAGEGGWVRDRAGPVAEEGADVVGVEEVADVHQSSVHHCDALAAGRSHVRARRWSSAGALLRTPARAALRMAARARRPRTCGVVGWTLNSIE